jgi:hypothetical protein
VPKEMKANSANKQRVPQKNTRPSQKDPTQTRKSKTQNAQRTECGECVQVRLQKN